MQNIKYLGIADVKNQIGIVQKQEILDLLDQTQIKSSNIKVEKNITHPIYDAYKIKELDQVSMIQNLFF